MRLHRVTLSYSYQIQNRLEKEFSGFCLRFKGEDGGRVSFHRLFKDKAYVHTRKKNAPLSISSISMNLDPISPRQLADDAGWQK